MSTPTLLDPAAVAADLIGAAPAAAVAPAATPTPSAPQTQPTAEIPAPSGPKMPTPDGKIDRAGRVFDAARYKSRPDGSPFLNKDGYFMPIGGKRKAVAGAAPAPAAQPIQPAAPDSKTLFDALPPGPSGAAWSDVQQAEAAKAVPNPAAAEAAAEAAKADDPMAGVDTSADAAEVLTRTLYFTTGVLIGSVDEATPPKSEHENFRQAAAAYIRTTGWKGTPLVCLILRTCAYLLSTFQKPKAAAKVQEWLSDFRKAKPAQYVAPERPQPAQSQQTRPASAPAYVGGFSERAGG